MINSNPETVSTDFDASIAALLRAARPGERAQRHRRRVARRARTSCPAVVAYGGQTPLNLAAPAGRRRRAAARLDLEAIDQAEERTRFSALLDRLGIPQPEGGMAHSRRGGADPRRADRLPGHRPAVVRHRRPGHRLLLLAVGPRPPAGGGHGRRPRPARPDRPLPRGRRGRRRRRLGRRARAHPGAPRARRAGRRPLAATRSGCSRRRPSSDGDQALIVATMERIVLALGARGLVNAQFIVRDDGVYLIEVNPRASRTVPFMSKVTGVPMVELAVRISLGATLPRARLGRRPPAAAGRSSRSRRRPSRRPSCAAWTRRSGPGCSRPARSSASTRTRGSRWPRRSSGAALVPPRPGADGALALLSIADRDKGTLPRLAAALAGAGYRLAATPGHAGGARRRPATRRGRSPSSARPPTRPPARSRSSTSSRRARSGSWSTRRRRAPAPSATPPRSASPRRPRGSCA